MMIGYRFTLHLDALPTVIHLFASTPPKTPGQTMFRI